MFRRCMAGIFFLAIASTITQFGHWDPLLQLTVNIAALSAAATLAIVALSDAIFTRSRRSKHTGQDTK